MDGRKTPPLGPSEPNTHRYGNAQGNGRGAGVSLQSLRITFDDDHGSSTAAANHTTSTTSAPVPQSSSIFGGTRSFSNHTQSTNGSAHQPQPWNSFTSSAAMSSIPAQPAAVKSSAPPPAAHTETAESWQAKIYELDHSIHRLEAEEESIAAEERMLKSRMADVYAAHRGIDHQWKEMQSGWKNLYEEQLVFSETAPLDLSQETAMMEHRVTLAQEKYAEMETQLRMVQQQLDSFAYVEEGKRRQEKLLSELESAFEALEVRRHRALQCCDIHLDTECSRERQIHGMLLEAERNYDEELKRQQSLEQNMDSIVLDAQSSVFMDCGGISEVLVPSALKADRPHGGSTADDECLSDPSLAFALTGMKRNRGEGRRKPTFVLENA